MPDNLFRGIVTILDRKSTIYWLLSMLALAICLVYSGTNSYDKSNNSLPLIPYLKVEPKFFFYSDNHYHAAVPGQLRLNINTEKLPHDLTHFDALIITDYIYKQNIQITLNWRVKDHVYQRTLNQNTHSINPIDFQTKNVDEIEDLHLMINSLPELGINHSFQDQISFKSIHLGRLENQSQMATNLSHWNHFTPLKLSAINGYTNSSNLHLKSLIYRLGSWVIISTLMFLLFKIDGKHLLLTFFMAWMFSSFFFVSSRLKQHDQIKHAFSNEQKLINAVDQDSLRLADLITAQLNQLSKQFPTISRYVLVGSNSFFKLRLKHHLRHFNLAIHFDKENPLNSSRDKEFIFIAVKQQVRYCNYPARFDWLDNSVEVLHVDEDFCLLRKK